MPKFCSAPGCDYNVFSHGYCQRHQYLRNDEKYKKVKMKTSPKRSKPNGSDGQFGRDVAFYMRIWNKRKHICEYCGDPIYGEPHTYNFDHILEKNEKAFPSLRHEEINVKITCFSCHQVKTSGKYTSIMEFVIVSTVKTFLTMEKLIEVGEKNIYKIKDWIIEKKDEPSTT